MSSVWLVWDGEYEPVLMDIFAVEADARRSAHELRKAYARIHGPKGFGPHVVTVEEREVKS